MEAELVGLASSGATALVGLMVSDAWSGARDRVSRFLNRNTVAAAAAAGDDAGGDDAGGELEASRAELVAAREDGDDALAGDVEAHWRTRLRSLLSQDPAAAEELRALLAELTAADDRAAGGAGRTAGWTVDLRDARGVQVGDANTQHNQF